MSFTVKGDDLVGGRGAPLPNRVYLATIEVAEAQQKDNGKQVWRQYGNLRDAESGLTEFEQADGSTYHIGNRKVSSWSWWQHNNPDAERIGQRELFREAVALGLVEKPEKGQETVFPFETAEDYATEIVGREVKIKTRLRQKQTKDKKPVTDEDGNPVFEAGVVEWLAI